MPENFENPEKETEESKKMEIPHREAPFEEKERFFNEHPELLTEPGYLNNFYLNLPGNPRRSQFEEFNLLDIPQKKMARQEGTEDPTKREAARISERKYNGTLRDFYQDIDDAIIEAGLGLAEIKEEIRKTEELPAGDEKAQRKKDLEKKLLTAGVYRILREQGYTHYDLWQ